MKRKPYEKPTMHSVEVRPQRIICISGGRQSYGTANDGVDESELDESGTWNWN